MKWMSPNKHGIDTKWNSSGFVALVSGIRQDSDENVKCLRNKKCGRGQQWLGLLLFFHPLNWEHRYLTQNIPLGYVILKEDISINLWQKL